MHHKMSHAPPRLAESVLILGGLMSLASEVNGVIAIRHIRLYREVSTTWLTSVSNPKVERRVFRVGTSVELQATRVGSAWVESVCHTIRTASTYL